MRKYLIYLIIFFSAIIGINNINAASVSLNYDSTWTNNLIQNEPIEDINNILIPFIEENMQDYNVIITLQERYNTSPTEYGLSIWIFDSIDNKIPTIQTRNRYNYVSGITFAQVGSINGDGFASSYGQQSCFHFSWTFRDNDSGVGYGTFSDLMSYLSSWVDSPIFDNSGISDLYNINFLQFTAVSSDDVDVQLFNSQGYADSGLTYYSNVNPTIITSNAWVNYSRNIKVNFNDKTYIYNFGDKFPTYKYMLNKYGGDYSLNQTINCENIDRIEISIDIPVRQIFNWNFSYDIYYSEIENQVIFPTYKYYSSHEYIDIELPLRYEKIDTLSEDINHNEVYSMNGSISMGIGSPETYPPGYDYLKIIIDTSDYNDTITIDFNCNYNMTLNTITNQVAENEKNYITVDMTNKYGIYLIPKADGYQREKVYLNGNYKAFIYDSYDARESMSDDNRKLLETIDDTDNPFVYYFDYYKRYMILFTNKNYTDNNYQTNIIFDADIFNYVIKEKPYDTPIIIDPNTNEEIKIYDDDSYITDSKSDFINTLSKSFENDNIKQLIANIYNEFQKSGIGFYIFIIIGSSIILLIIKTIRK